MNGLLMGITVASALLGNAFKNFFSKQYLKNQTDNLSFNLIGHALVIVILALFGGACAVAPFTLRLSCIMGVANLVSGLLFTLALASGPMALTTLINLGISLVASALWGPIFWNEKITAFQFGGIVLMLLAMTLTSNAKVDKNITFKWVILTIAAGFANSSLGLLQKVLTTSEYKDQQMGFLFYAFTVCTVCNMVWFLLRKKKEPVSFQYNRILLVGSLVCGATMAAQHIINLRLVGILPTVVFFPICTGLRILLTALMGIVIFKEKLSKRQAVGFAIGFISLFFIAGIFG